MDGLHLRFPVLPVLNLHPGDEPVGTLQEASLRTMRSWNVRVDEAFFLGGLEKRDVLKAFPGR